MNRVQYHMLEGDIAVVVQLLGLSDSALWKEKVARAE